jgi:hypothetical protein
MADPNYVTNFSVSKIGFAVIASYTNTIYLSVPELQQAS